MANERRTSGIVTPEAVLLEFETAGVGSRGVARIIDLAIQAGAFLMLLLAGGLVVALVSSIGGTPDDDLLAGLVGLAAAVALLAYPIVLESRFEGRTLGKAALGLRVVTREGGPVRVRHAAIRTVVGIIEVLSVPFVAVLSTTMSPANQRIGDLTAGTIVIRERSAARSAVALAFPPPRGWEGYAGSLDVSVLTAEQYRIVRSFLTRVLAFTPEARPRLATRLANPLALAMRHTPPAHLGPELFLVCVASAYQSRHGLGTSAR